MTFPPRGSYLNDMDNSQRQPGQHDLFFYTGVELEFEDLTKYKQYGLHPIVLGDVLPKESTCVSDLAKKPRYRIMLKLGFGAFATVWLARDLVEKYTRPNWMIYKTNFAPDDMLPSKSASGQIRLA